MAKNANVILVYLFAELCSRVSDTTFVYELRIVTGTN